MVNVVELERYDKLPNSIKKKFVEDEIEFFYPLWFQCTMLTSSDKEAYKMFRTAYLKNVIGDPSTLVIPNKWRK